MISYNRLATEIYQILSAPSYDYTLKMYNSEGDSTTTPKKVKWIYVEPDDIVLRLPVEGGARTTPEANEVYFWKNQEIDDDRMISIIKRMRKICNLYGVGLTVKDFSRSKMPKRFSDMTEREIEEDNMEESIKRLGPKLFEAEMQEEEMFYSEVGDLLGEILGDNDIGLVNFNREDRRREIDFGPIVVIQSWKRDGSPMKPVTTIYIDDVAHTIGRFAIFGPDEYAEDLASTIKNIRGQEEDDDMEPEFNEGDSTGTIIDVPGSDERAHEIIMQFDPGAIENAQDQFMVDPEVADDILGALYSAGYDNAEESYLMEGMHGSDRRSFFELGEAKMVVVHEGTINPEKHGARSRNIKEVYVESNGERFRLPGKFLPGGRALCRHLNEGGKVLDKTGRKIMEVVKEASSLRGFIREYRKTQTATDLLEMARSRVRSLRESCGRMTGPKNYYAFKESFTKSARIGKDRITEMKNHLVASVGLNEDQEIHEGFDYLAKMKVMESSDSIRNVGEALSLLEGGEEANTKELATDLVLKKVGNGLSREQKETLSFMKGVGVKKLWKEHGGDIADKFDMITMAIKDDFLSNLFSRIVDQVTNDDEVKKGELAIANMIKDGVIGNAISETMMQEAQRELMEFVNDAAFGFMKESNYPDNFRGLPGEDSADDESEAVAYMQDLIDQAIQEFDPAEWDFDLNDEVSFAGALETIVDDSVYVEMEDRYPDYFTWEEMEDAVAVKLRDQMQMG